MYVCEKKFCAEGGPIGNFPILWPRSSRNSTTHVPCNEISLGRLGMFGVCISTRVNEFSQANVEDRKDFRNLESEHQQIIEAPATTFPMFSQKIRSITRWTIA